MICAQLCKIYCWIIILFVGSCIVLHPSNAIAQCTPVIGTNPATLSGCDPFSIQFFDQTPSNCFHTLSWDFGDGSTSTSTNPFYTFDSIANDTSYTVTLTIKDISNTVFSTTVTITVYAKPQTFFTIDKDTVCAVSDQACFTNTSATGTGYSNFWKFGDGNVFTGFDTCHNYGIEGFQYVSLTVTNNHSCANEYDDSVFVNEVPSPQFVTDVSSGCAPLAVTFTNLTSQSSVPITNWLWDFGDGTTSTSSIPSIHDYANADTFLISLSATNAIGCSNTTSFPVLVLKTPTSTFTRDSIICLNDSSLITYTGDAGITAIFDWDLDTGQTDIFPANLPFYVFWDSSGTKTITLNVTENSCSSITSHNVSVNQLPQFTLTSDDADSIICAGSDVKFSVSPTDYMLYDFYKDGVLMQSSISPFYTVTNAASTFSVYVIVQDSILCSNTSIPIQITVNPLPVTTLTSDAANDTLCKKQTVVFTATAGYDSYDFYDKFLKLITSAANFYADNSIQDGHFYYAIATNNGCTGLASNSFSYTMIDSLLQPVVNCGTTTINSVEFVWDTVNGAIGYEISLDEGGSFITPSSGAMGFDHTVNGLASQDTVSLIVRALGNAPCGNSILSDTVFCIAQPCTKISYNKVADFGICVGDTATNYIYNLSTPSNQFYINWENISIAKDSIYLTTPTINTSVKVIVGDSSEPTCPAVTKYINIKVDAIPTFTIKTFGDTICENDSLYVWVDEGAYDNYTYQLDGTTVQDTIYPFVTFQNNSSGNHSVQLTVSNAGCTNSAIHNFYTNPTPIISIISSDADNAICKGSNVVFTATTNFDEYFFYQMGYLKQDSVLNTYSTTKLQNNDSVWAIAVDQYGCTSNASTAITTVVYNIPNVSISSSDVDHVICKGENITILASPATQDNYSFYNNFYNFYDGVNASVQISDLKNGHTVYAYATNQGCVSAKSNVLAFTVKDSLTTPFVYCGNSTNNTIQFLWDSVLYAKGYEISLDTGKSFFTPSSGITGLSHIVTGLNPTDTLLAIVRALGSDPCGNSLQSVSQVCFVPCSPVDFTKNPYSQTAICMGDSITLSISNIQTPTSQYSITWGNQTSGLIKSIIISPKQDTSIAVTIMDSSVFSCTPTTKYFSILVNQVPAVSLTATTNTVICESDSITFSASPTYFDNYEFFEGFLSLQNSANPTLVAANIKSGHSITVVASNDGCASTASQPITVTVLKSLTKPDLNCGYSNLDSIQFVWDSVPNAIGYEISINGSSFFTPSSGTTGLQHLLSGLNANDTVIAQVVALGGVPCGNSILSDTVICATVPCTAVDFTKSANPQICENDVTILSISNIISPSNAYGIVWDGSNVINGLSYSISALQDTTVTVSLIDSSQLQCFPVTKHFYIDVNKYPTANINSTLISDSICDGKTIQFTLSQAGYDDYQFYLNNSLVQDSTYHKYTNNSFTIGDNQLFSIVTDYGCSTNSDTILIHNISYPALTVISSDVNDSICLGDAITLTASSGYDRYDFYSTINLLQTSAANTLQLDTLTKAISLFTISSNESFCFRNSDTTTIEVLSIPAITLTHTAINDSICSGDSILFTASPTGFQQYSFYNNGILMQSSSANIFSTTSLTNGNQITAVAKNYDCNASAIDSFTITVVSIPTITLNADSFGLCYGDSVVITASGATSYLWNTGDITSSISKIALNDTLFTVIGFENNCASAEDSIHVYVDPITITNADAGIDVVICKGQSTMLQASGGDHYFWYSNDSTLNDSIISNPTVTPIDTNAYYVRVYNQFCFAIDSVSVLVDPCYEDVSGPIPTVISPNGDGSNDTWIIPDIDYFANNHVLIYNQWGNIVYEKQPYDNSWIGTNNKGKNLADGTYYFVVDLGNGVSHTGYVMIHR